MEDALVGLRVKIVIVEDGTVSPPVVPPGTLIRSLVGTDRETYFMVRLDHPVRTRRIPTTQDWILHTLIIKNRYKGQSMKNLITPPLRKELTVGISNVLTEIPADELVLDFAKVDYFAIGKVSIFPEKS